MDISQTRMIDSRHNRLALHTRLDLLLCVLSLLFLSACGGDTPSTDEIKQTDSAVATTPPTIAPPESTMVDTTTPGPREITPIDPATGTMTATASGAHSGAWTFKDVNGAIVEQAGGGETVSRLQLEGHDEPAHFKIRLGSSDGEITAGRYVVGSTEKGVDATFEISDVYYKSLGGASGTVSVTEITADRAKGTFDLSLETLAEDPTKSRVQGTFDMRVQR